MTDDNENNKPNTAPAGTSDEPEKQPLRKISDYELQTILTEHKKWLESGQKEGSRADLSYVDFSQNHWEITTVELDRPGSVLDQGPNLNRAILVGAKLSGVDLPGVLLNEANISGADFSHSDLTGAKFQDANAEGAQFQNAVLTRAWMPATNLSHANLEGAKLSGGHLENANLFGANVRQADFERADMRHVTLGTMSFSHANLHDCNLEGASGWKGFEFARADITGATLPKAHRGFESLKVVEEISKNARKIFLAMLLGCAYAWLTIFTTTDARLILNSASSPLPIIRTEIPIAYFYLAAPFILIGLFVYLHLYLQRLWEGLSKLPAIFEDGKRLDERAYPWLLNGLVRRHFERLRKSRSLMAHLEEYTSILLAWCVMPLTLGAFWYRYLWRHEWFGTSLHIGLIVLSLVTAIIIYRSHTRTLSGKEQIAFPWLRFYRDRRTYQAVVVAVIGIALLLGSVGAIEGLNITSGIIGKTRCLARADLRDAQLSIKPPNYWSLDPAVRDSAVIGADLNGADLRCADLVNAFLVNANLRFANLSKTVVMSANLMGADLSNTNLHRSNLSYANLTETLLLEANLTEAGLVRANLTGANLYGADLTGAILIDADLTGANLMVADLTGTELIDADLTEANLMGAVLTGVDLKGAALTRADLMSADLRGADLSSAIGLTQAQLDQACGDTRIKLPPGLTIKQCPEQ